MWIKQRCHEPAAIEFDTPPAKSVALELWMRSALARQVNHSPEQFSPPETKDAAVTNSVADFDLSSVRILENKGMACRLGLRFFFVGCSIAGANGNCSYSAEDETIPHDWPIGGRTSDANHDKRQAGRKRDLSQKPCLGC